MLFHSMLLVFLQLTPHRHTHLLYHACTHSSKQSLHSDIEPHTRALHALFPSPEAACTSPPWAFSSSEILSERVKERHTQACTLEPYPQNAGFLSHTKLSCLMNGAIHLPGLLPCAYCPFPCIRLLHLLLTLCFHVLVSNAISIVIWVPRSCISGIHLFPRLTARVLVIP